MPCVIEGGGVSVRAPSHEEADALFREQDRSVKRSEEAEESTGLRSGWYLDNGRRAHCIVHAAGVAVHYDDGFKTAATHQTFRRWGLAYDDDAEVALDHSSIPTLS